MGLLMPSAPWITKKIIIVPGAPMRVIFQNLVTYTVLLYYNKNRTGNIIQTQPSLLSKNAHSQWDENMALC